MSDLGFYRVGSDGNTVISLSRRPHWTLSGDPPPVSPPTTAPTLSRTGLTHNTATLAWTTVTGDGISYELRRNGSPVYSGAALSYVDSGLNPQTPYSWEVLAKNSGGVGPASNTVSETTPAAPAEPGDSLHLLYTELQVTEARNRMSGAGPFYSTGQGFDGAQANAPGDGVRALNRAADFLANPAASEWVTPVPIASGSPWPGETGGTEQHLRWMSAAWCYMTMPDHPNRAQWRDQAKSLLMWTATRSQHNFENATNYPFDSYPGFAPSPIFALSGWMHRWLKVYDMLGRNNFDASERATLDRWFYGHANYMLRFLHSRHGLGSRIPGREAGDYTSTHSDFTSVMEYRAYDGGPFIQGSGYWHTNRHASMAAAGALIANYLKFHDVAPAASGSAPYGYLTVDQMLVHAKAYACEFVMHSLAPLGFTGDFHRGFIGTNPQAGLGYAPQEMGGPVSIASFFASRGDMSVINYTTTGGNGVMAGSPTTETGVTGHPSKSLHWAVVMLGRYVNNAWNRTVGGVNPWDPNSVRDILPAAKLGSYFPGDAFVRSMWTRSGNGMPGYLASPGSIGRWNGLDGDQGKSVGLIEETL